MLAGAPSRRSPQKLARSLRLLDRLTMGRDIAVRGFLFTRDDWERLDDAERQIFTRYLAEESHRPDVAADPPGRRRRARAAPR